MRKGKSLGDWGAMENTLGKWVDMILSLKQKEVGEETTGITV